MLVLSALAMMSIGKLSAQTDIARYTFAQSTSTYTPITGGTVLVAANANYDDLNSPAVTIPAFSFGGATVTTVYVNSNGYITFGASFSSYTPLSSSATDMTGVVAGLGCDHGYSSGNGTTGATSEIRYEQVGNEFVAQYQDVKRWNSTNERITFQIRLNSATGEIKIVYGGPVVIGSSTATPQIGIRGNSTTWSSNVNNLRLQNVPSGTTCNWSNAVTGNANDASFAFSTANTNMAPTTGLTYTWTPAATVAPVRTFSAVTNLTGSGATLNFTAPTGATQYNVQYRIPGTCTWTNYAGNPVTATSSIVLTGLPSATTLQVRVQSSNGTNNAIWSHIPNQAGTGDGYTTTGTFTTLCGTPAPGPTLASQSTNLCANAAVTFSLTNQTPGGGVTYQWQSSADNVTYSNISGATANTYTGPAIAKYYRCMVKCAAGPDSTASAPVQLTYNNNVTNTTPAQRCGVGTVNLAAAGSAGTTLKWYSAVTGGTALGTGTNFTTPSINNTTTYYVGAETGSPSTATIGTATTLTSATSQPTAFCNRWEQYWCQMVYTAAELTAAGLTAGYINSITFNITTLGDGTNVTNFTVALGTAPSTLTGFTTTGLTTVYGPATYAHTVGANTINFDGSYYWDGTSNILVDLRQNGADLTNNAITYFTATTNNTCASAVTSDATPVLATNNPTATLNGQRLNIVFSQPACSSPRVPVVATVNTPPTFTVTPNLTICNNAITQLSVTSTLSNFNSYTWSPVTNLYTDAAATVAYTAGSNASTVYFKSNTAAATTYTASANNSTTQCAAIATTAVTVLPAAVTATAAPDAICQSGTATLTLTPSSGYGAAGFQWQSSTDNIGFSDETVNATSANYTTPTLTATKYYRVVLKNSSGVTCLNSVSDTARVNNPAITGTTPASRCGTGVVNLAATANTGATLVWYAAATGGTSVATGSPYSPNVSATTNYWVAARMPGIGSSATTTIGSATTTTTATEELTAFCNRRINYRMQMIFTAAELQAAGIGAGNITSIGFNITSLGDAASNNNYTVKIGTTAQSTFSTYITTGLNTVYGPSTYTHVVGLNTITFATPFPWDGAANIVVEVTHDGIDQINNAQTYYTATTNNMAGYSYNSNATASTTTKRFNTTFGYTLPCESPRQQVTATVNPLPTITVTPSGTVQICSGSTTTLTATGGGNYQWRNTAGNISGQTNNTFTTGTAGTYKVVVTTPATGCTDSSAAITVNVNPAPTVFIGNDTTFCSGNTLTLNAGNPGATYLWNNNSTNQTRAVTTTGTYWVKVTNSNNCSKTDTIQVTVNPTPVVNLGNDTNLCLGVNYVLNAANPGAAKLWDNGTTAQTRTVTATGTYYVRVTNSFNCIGRDTVTTTFLPAPVVNLGNDIDVCEGATVTLDAAGNSGDTYLWDNGTTQQTREVTTTGIYHVTVSNIAVNCKGRDTIQVTVHPLPVVNLGNDTVFCHGNTLTLDAGNPGATYLWSDNSTGQTLDVNNTGNYGVVVTDVHTCVSSDNINILVKSLPSGIINAVYGDSATYTFNVLNPQYVTGYTWNFGDGSPLVTGTMVHHQYTQNGIYTVSVQLNGECDDSILVARTIDVFDAGGPTGIEQLEDSKDVVLYPNPARDVVIIENKNNLRMKQITVYNVVGQVLSSTKADSADKHKLHTDAYAAGIYTVRIETEKGMVIRKFEIMK